MGWQELATSSHYQTAVAIEQELEKGNIQEATAGVKELIEALGRSEKRALKSHLVRLMVHIIKWQTQPERRSYSWAATIYNAREEIRDIQTETPSLTDTVIQEMWERCFLTAKREAEGDMNQAATVTGLSWREVFEDLYEKQ
ncbi:MAG: DUF29 domain-containing protein [Candidatus Binatia bacterium]